MYTGARQLLTANDAGIAAPTFPGRLQFMSPLKEDGLRPAQITAIHITSISFICRLIKFGEEYIIQHLQSNQFDSTARVTICTIQRLFSMLKGRELAPEDDEQSVDDLENVAGGLFARPDPKG